MAFLIITILFQSLTQVLVIKNNMHTGIVITVNPEAAELIPAVDNFKEYKYIDIGWGDEDFYQHPDPDILLGAKAILVPTNSVLRLEGINTELYNIVKWSDFCIRFDLNEEQLLILYKFISGSFSKDQFGNYILISQSEQNKVKFYKSGYKYYLFYTCNTWVAEAFEKCGYDLSSSNVITAENLFEELYKFGTVLKQEFNNN